MVFGFLVFGFLFSFLGMVFGVGVWFVFGLFISVLDLVLVFGPGIAFWSWPSQPCPWPVGVSGASTFPPDTDVWEIG